MMQSLALEQTSKWTLSRDCFVLNKGVLRHKEITQALTTQHLLVGYIYCCSWPFIGLINNKRIN